MKKLIFTLSVSSLAIIANAQFTKGQKVLGGSFNFSHTRIDGETNFDTKTRYTTGFVNLSLGSFKNEKTLNSLVLYYNHNYTRQPSSTAYQSRSQSVGAGFSSARFIPISNRFYFTVTGTALGVYNFTKTDYTNPSTESTNYKELGAIASLSPGLSYQVSKHFLLDVAMADLLRVAYSHGWGDAVEYTGFGTYKIKSNSFSINSFLSGTVLNNITVGFRWLL